MPQSKFFRFLYGLTFVLLIIYLGTKVPFIFTPIQVLFGTLFIPFLIAGVLFYLLRPVVNLLHKQKVPKPLSILLIYLGAVGLMTGLVFLIGPTLQEQWNNLVDNAPGLFNEVRNMLIELQNNEWVNQFQETENFSIEEITENFTEYLSNAFEILTRNIASVIGVITSILILAIIIPFILFYMLKDGEKLPDQVLRYLPKKQRGEGHRILSDLDTALSSYIQGQIIVSFCVGVLMYISFLIIGIEYSLILALVAMVTNVIPFIGPWIGTIPAVIVAIIDSPWMVVKVLIAIVVVQQIESNVISPQVMGKKLAVHPLTIILLLLVAGQFAGLFGLLLAVPTYAVSKVVVSHTYRLYMLKRKQDHEKKGKEEAEAAESD
ncbi:AI-2E family transporter [Alteribacter keqinensis]|uniref:AI-2E family transporter n=1 Tax=Alteribacter keqinensis TaxID=2483800 RepID=A0A3M7TX55_9BACI|nr:AI-2E family transporter [Alteribacter keqinensis]RNA70083.1 AI-2E family transporter [Alteribacter keqinensis]